MRFQTVTIIFFTLGLLTACNNQAQLEQELSNMYDKYNDKQEQDPEADQKQAEQKQADQKQADQKDMQDSASFDWLETDSFFCMSEKCELYIRDENYISFYITNNDNKNCDFNRTIKITENTIVELSNKCEGQFTIYRYNSKLVNPSLLVEFQKYLQKVYRSPDMKIEGITAEMSYYFM